MHTGVHASKIDSLSAKDEVQNFLATALGENGLLMMNRCAGISFTESDRIYNQLYFTVQDTIVVEDPVTRQPHYKTTQRDVSGLRVLDTQSRFSSISNNNITRLMDRNSWQIHKADIDRNGYTDLVIDIDTAGVAVVMDMGNKFEGHVLVDNRDFYSYNFKKFISLPDGNTALVLRHNPCTLGQRSSRPKTISYIIDTVTNQADTLYKIITMVDSIYLWKGGVRTYSHRWVDSDTIDMKRYRATDTIVYKFGGFVKYNPNTNHAAIAKIAYHQLFNFDDPGNACIEVNKNGTCFLHYEQYDTMFSGRLNNTARSGLWGLAEYLDANTNNYSNNRNNAAIQHGNVFVIHFNDGTTKEIVYGKCRPPMALGQLSKKLSEASYTIHWQPVDKSVDLDCSCTSRPVVEWSSSLCDCDSIDEVW